MKTELLNNFILISSKKDLDEFINNNEKVYDILEAIKPQLIKHFPNNEFSLQICDKLTWTSESKLLLNVSVSEEIFF